MNNKTQEEDNDGDDIKHPLAEHLWMLRSCNDYYDEYKECKSLHGRFHQYFIFGETIDCNQWKRDYENCKKFRKKDDLKAGEQLVESEMKRRQERLGGHYRNTVWKKRQKPPEDWDKPLPEWMQKRDETSYLSLKAKEFKENPDLEMEKDSFCVIM